MSTTWKTWLSLPVLGALACTAPGCHSESEPGESSVSVTESVPDAQTPIAAPAPALSAPATADLAPQTLPPLETLKQDAAQAVGTVDRDLKQVGQTIKQEAAQVQAELPQAPTTTAPGAPSPILDSFKKDVGRAVGTIDGKTRRTAAELEQVVQDKADALEHDVKQAVGRVRSDVQKRAEEIPANVLRKAEKLGKETLQGLQAPKTPPTGPQ